MICHGSKLSKDPWIRVYDIKEAIKHKKGYTIYKVVSKVFPRNSVEAITEVAVWKRYSDFKKLNKSLVTLHQSLHLKGSFPKFIQAQFFGRFDQDVIEERKKCAIELLQFASKFPALYNSQVFVKFFEDGQDVYVECEETATIPASDILKPLNESKDLTASNLDLLSPNSEPQTPLPLDGTWNHHQSGDDISLSSDCSDWTTEESAGNTPLPRTDLSLFDPLSNSTMDKTKRLSNSWLLSAIESCSLVNEDTARLKTPSPNPFDFPEPFANDSIDGPKYFLGGGGGDGEPEIFLSEAPKNSAVEIIQSESKPASFIGSTLSLSQLIIPKSEDSYLIEAATVISAAKDFESESNFADAFAKYKDAVGVLLSGVQGEADQVRRDSVRRKIAQYLSHAEWICSEYLRDTLRQDNLRWAAAANRNNTNTPSHSPNRCGPSGDESIRGQLDELSRYRVLGIVGRLMLVLDLSSNQTRVIKCLQKSSSPIPGSPNIVPQFIPFMVKLLRIYETEDCLYLVLLHASGGKLWDYVSTYMERSPLSPANQFTPSLKVNFNEDANVYSGLKLHNVGCAAGEDRVECGKTASVDSDLNAPAECSSSYVQLFTHYASSGELEDQEPESTTVTQIKEEHGAVFFTNTTKDSLVTEEDKQLKDSFTLDNWQESCANVGEVESLLEHSRALLQTVDETLKATENPTSPSAECNDNRTTFSTENKTPRRQSRERRPSRRQSINQKTSYNKQKSGELSRHLSSSMGSLELRGPTQRVRQLSEIFHQLDANRESAALTRLPESCVRIWAAEIVTALSQLHLLGIVWQDLNPDNILLGERGHILLTYMCRWNCVDRQCNLTAKKNMYAAPEVGGIFPVTPACDWWSLGAVLYELLTGRSLVQSHPTGITSHTRLFLPTHLSIEAKDFLDKLLRYLPPERLGAGTHGIESLRDHPFFAGIEWTKLALVP